MFDKLDVGAFVTAIEADSAAGIMFTVAVTGLLLSVVVMLLHFLFNMLACSPKGKIRNYTIDISYIVLVLISMGLFMFIPENPFVSGSLGIGAFLYLALVILNFVIDILVFRESIEIKHAQCFVGGIPIEEYFEMVEKGVAPEEIRAEMYKRLTAIQREQEARLEEKNTGKEEAVNG